jgi:hypothetical protein
MKKVDFDVNKVSFEERRFIGLYFGLSPRMRGLI